MRRERYEKVKKEMRKSRDERLTSHNIIRIRLNIRDCKNSIGTAVYKFNRGGAAPGKGSVIGNGSPAEWALGAAVQLIGTSPSSTSSPSEKRIRPHSIGRDLSSIRLATICGWSSESEVISVGIYIWNDETFANHPTYQKERN